jgi:hypothetical protein
VDADEVLRVQNAVLILARGIDDLEGVVLVSNLDLFTKGILDGGIVALDKMVIDISNGERGFAWTINNY